MILVGFDFADFAGPVGKKGIHRTNQLCRCGGTDGEAEGFKEGGCWAVSCLGVKLG